MPNNTQTVTSNVAGELDELAALHSRLFSGTNAFVAIGTSSSAISSSIDGGRDNGYQATVKLPPGHVPFLEDNGIPIPAVGAGDTVVLQFDVPDGFDGFIRHISNYFTGAGFVDFSGDIIWRILANDRPIRNFANIRAQRGGVGQDPREVSDIPIFSGQTIKYIVNHASNVGLNGNIVCSLEGYYYPKVR